MTDSGCAGCHSNPLEKGSCNSMDPWKDIRLLARQKHLELMVDRKDYTAEELLAAAEESTGIKRQGVPAGDSLLFGAEAMLDLTHSILWYNNNLGSELAAYYQAHEYAHYWIDDKGASCSSEHLDYEALETELPVGVNRVEGYGPQERRELQANVFAREFLVPSHKLRDSFIADRENAASIAQRIAVYEGLVHHQLMHALLNPYGEQLQGITERELPEEPKYRLDPKQDQASRAPGGPLLLEAGPGTGKTSTLLGRIQHLLGDRQIKASAILALTFSNKAAEEMRARVARIAPDAAPHIWMGTFHAFGLEVLRKYGTRIGLSEKPAVLERAAAILMLERRLAALKLNHYMILHDPVLNLVHILGAISRAKDELITPEKYKELVEEQLNKAQTEDDIKRAEKALEVAHVYEVYEHMLAESDAIDFGDLIYKTVRLLQEHTDVRDQIRREYTHILVDEFQDVNFASGVLLKEIAGAGEGLWVVGDARQSIYRFRGAAPRNVSAFPDHYVGASHLSLEMNYRSQPKIVEAVEVFARQMQAVSGDDFAGWEAQRPDEGGGVIVKVADNLAAEAKFLADEIKQQEAAGVAFRDQAVLCRTHTQLAQIAEQLELHGIPVLYMGELFEREEIRDLLALLSLVSEPHGTGLIRVSQFPEYRIPRSDVLKILEISETQEGTFLESLSRVDSIEDLTEDGQAGLLRLRAHLAGAGFSTTAWSLLANYLFSSSSYLRKHIEDKSVAGQQRRLAIHQFLAFAYAYREKPPDITGDPKRWFLDTVRRLQTFGETKQLRQLPDSADAINAVRMLTVHASKGLEFRVVFIPYLGKGNFPIRRQWERCPPPQGMLPQEAEDWHDHEEECLFFVGMSRAKDVLHLSRATSYGKSGSNHSRVLDLIGHLLPDDYGQPAKKPDGKMVDAPKLIRSAREFTGKELDLYLRCSRRYFYQHGLGLAGRNEESAYVQFHRCVYRVLDWINVERREGQGVAVQDALDQLGQHWGETELTDHGYGTFYYDLAVKMVQNAASREPKLVILEDKTIPIKMEAGVIRFRPDQVVERQDGKRLLRRLRTGRIGTSEKAKGIYALYQRASKQELGDATAVEIVSLSDDVTEEVEMSDKVTLNRLAEYEKAMGEIQAGVFVPQPKDNRDCPSCPYYFICPSPVDSE